MGGRHRPERPLGRLAGVAASTPPSVSLSTPRAMCDLNRLDRVIEKFSVQLRSMLPSSPAPPQLPPPETDDGQAEITKMPIKQARRATLRTWYRNAVPHKQRLFPAGANPCGPLSHLRPCFPAGRLPLNKRRGQDSTAGPESGSCGLPLLSGAASGS